MNTLPYPTQPFQIVTDITVFGSGAYVLKRTHDDICIDLDMICNIHLYIVLWQPCMSWQCAILCRKGQTTEKY